MYFFLLQNKDKFIRFIYLFTFDNLILLGNGGINLLRQILGEVQRTVVQLLCHIRQVLVGLDALLGKLLGEFLCLGGHTLQTISQRFLVKPKTKQSVIELICLKNQKDLRCSYRR